jgi:hypothetical protein
MEDDMPANMATIAKNLGLTCAVGQPHLHPLCRHRPGL